MGEEEEGKVYKTRPDIGHGRATFGMCRANSLSCCSFCGCNVARPCHF